jgi:predicted nucleic acid-binding protein
MFLLDTNVISDLRKAKSGKADLNVANWFRTIPAASLFLSVIVVQEIEIGALSAARRDPAQGTILHKWLHEQVLPEFAGRILPVDTDVALQGAKLQIPKSRPIYDTLIAATALVHNMTIVTRNVMDFEPMGAPILNPWNAKL